jgi:hypothetical protein
MNQNLVHVEKNAHKKEGGALPVVAKKPVAGAGAKKVEEVKREPKTEFKMYSYYIVIT